MRTFILNLCNRGASRHADPSLQRIAFFLNQFLILAFCCLLISIIVNLIISTDKAAVYYAVPIFLFLIFSMYLNCSGRLNGALITLFLFINFLLAFFTLNFGLEGLAFMFYFPVMLGLMFLFNDDRFSGVFNFIFSLTLITALASLSLAFMNYTIHVEELESLRSTSPYLNAPLSLAMTAYMVVVFMRQQRMREHSLQHMVNEKQTLLSEVHHRVKNNLAIISSLLNLQKNSVEDSAIQRALDDSRNRIYTMALIHEKLYKNQTFSSIGFRDYAESLLFEYTRSSLKTRIRSVVDIDGISLVLGQAIPCGLILNELITNSIKHGFRDRKEGEIVLKMHKAEGKIFFDYGDNGRGVEDIIAMKEKETLGMTIIQSLSEQLNGVMHFSNENGLRFRLEFPEEFERQMPV